MIIDIKVFDTKTEAQDYLGKFEDSAHNYLLYPSQMEPPNAQMAKNLEIDKSRMEIDKSDSIIENIVRAFKGEDDLHTFLINHGASEEDIKQLYLRLHENKYVLIRTDGTKGPVEDIERHNVDLTDRLDERRTFDNIEEARSQAYWLERMIRP